LGSCDVDCVSPSAGRPRPDTAQTQGRMQDQHVTSTSQTLHPDGTVPTGRGLAITSLSHILPIAILRALGEHRGSRWMRGVLLVKARLQGIRYRALLAMAVGGVGG
jgi:hypothetical protein